VTWDGVDSVLSIFTATRDSTAPLPAEWPHGEWYRPGIIMELEPEEERGDGLRFYAYDLKLRGFPDDAVVFLADLMGAVGSPAHW
jgi:hypothetical protein